MFISVIIPTYHRNDLLRKTLECLKPGVQTLPAEQYEVIVTDDGSKSSAEAMIAADFPWVRWVQGPRRGPAANRNNGARHANYEWLAFTDDDCLPDPGWLEAYLKLFCADYQVYEGKTICRLGLKSPRMQSPINEGGGYLWSCNFAIKKSLFQNMNGFDESFPAAALEDVDFRERLRKKNYHFPFVPDALIDHPPRGAAWGSRRALQNESEMHFYFKHRKGFLTLRQFLGYIMMLRLRAIKHAPFSIDSITAFVSLSIELATTARRFYGWREKYLTMYPPEKLDQQLEPV